MPGYSLGDSGAGPFNRNAASIFLALCLPGFFRGRIQSTCRQAWWHLSPIVIVALFACRSSSGMLAATAGAFGFLAFWRLSARLRIKTIVMGLIVTLMSGGIFWWKIDPLADVFANPRWDAWKDIIRSFRSESFGRGLGSFRDLFPAMYPCGNSWMQAHNEYLQVGFEMGLQAVALILTYLGWFFVCAWRRRRLMSDHDRIIVAGVAALAVGCMGWHVFHIAPLALIGVAWLGMAQNIATGSRKGPRTRAIET